MGTARSARSFGDDAPSIEGIVAIGPARVVPLSVLVRHHPEVLDVLRAQLARGAPRSTDGVFVVRADRARPPRLTAALHDVLGHLGEAPVALEALAARSGLGGGAERAVARLEARGLVRRAGACPTDAALVLGEPLRGVPAEIGPGGASLEAARLGLELLLRGTGRAPDAIGLALAIEREMALRIALACASDALGTQDAARLRWLGEALVATAAGARPRMSLHPRLDVPIVGVGGPAHRHHPAAAALLGSTCRLPEHGNVANAVGAVVGTVRIERRVTVVPDSDGGGLRVLLASGPVRVAAPDEATTLAAERAGAEVLEAALAAGAAEPTVTLRRDDTVVRRDGRDVLIECVIVATAVGRPLEARPARPSAADRDSVETR